MSHLPPISDDLVARLDVPGPRYTSYPTVLDWSDRFGPTEHAVALALAARTPERPLSLYVHIPFCRELCTYCGCNVVVSRDPERADRYLACRGHHVRSERRRGDGRSMPTSRRYCW
jgi:oxygen-independent coproporphyrinogen III oxidase